jgi:transposase
MLSLPSIPIYLVTGRTDMRKGVNTLAALVRSEIKKDPLSSVFVFSNRSRDRLKLLFWHRGGFWVCAKRLERGSFAWPEPGTPCIELSVEELMLLVGGIDLKDTQPRSWYRPSGSS